jgi:hypothetical protein
MTVWNRLHPRATEDHLGFIAVFCNDDDPRSAREQLNDNYAHGGGFNPTKGFEMAENGELSYPGDLPMKPLWNCIIHGEEVRVYEHAWVAIINLKDNSFIVARMD